MGNFAHLKPGSESRQRFWDEHKERVRSILQEVLDDIYAGDGRIVENTTLASTVPFEKPNMVLHPNDKGWNLHLGICTYGDGSFRVVQMGAFETFSRVGVGADFISTAVEDLLKKVL